MPKTSIPSLAEQFFRTYDASAKDQIWKQQQEAFRSFWANRILATASLPLYSYEYRHGVSSYGAFTYCLSAVLRRSGHQGQALSFDELSKRVGKDLHELGCDQTPCLVGLPVYAPAFRKATTCTT